MSYTCIVGVDPGPVESGVVMLDHEKVTFADVMPNDPVLHLLRGMRDRAVVFEQIAAMGMSVGASVFETVFWTGRMYEAARLAGASPLVRIKRLDVKLHLCNSARAKDTNVRQALLDRFGGTDAVGTKKKPGPLFGVTSHAWSALALAVVFADRSRGHRSMVLCGHANEVPHKVQVGRCDCPLDCGCRDTVCSPLEEHRKRMHTDVNPY